MDNGIAIMTLPNCHSSFPVPIPISKLKHEIYPKQSIELNSGKNLNQQENPQKPVDPHQKVDAESIHSSVEEEIEEEFRLPDGSPTFTAVMSEMSSQLSKISVRDHIKIPVLPLVQTEMGFRPVVHDYSTTGSNSPESLDSPASPRKTGIIKNSVPRSRSYSWNHRNKMVVDRRKALSVSFQTDTSSNNSSLVVQSKKKAKARPVSSHPVPSHPKYKILTENITVSHEDLVKEQERERHLAEGFSEVKSIFQSRWFDRLGISPTQ